MKKILLINSNMENIPYPVPPLGLCLLQNVLEKNYLVKIHDCVFDQGTTLLETVDNYKPDYIGVSIRNVDNLNMYDPNYFIDKIYEKIVKPLKQHCKVPIILGGSGFGVFPEEIFKYYDVDYGIIGEGEYLFPYLLDCIENNKTINNENILTKNKQYSFHEVKQSFNFIDFKPSEIDLKIDFSPYKEKGAYSIQTKRGCYHKCIYCSYPLIEGTTYRLRNPKDIADEIEKAHQRLGYVTFEFVDSTFNDPMDHAEEICREIIKKNIKINLRTMGINPNNATQELFELMMKAGFTQIDCTPDTASVKMLKNFRKNFTIGKLENVAKIIKDFNIPTMWFFIFGGPGEDKNTANETLEFIDKWVIKLDMAHATVGIRIYPNTEVHKIAIKENYLKETDSILKPIFYVSPTTSFDELNNLITTFSKTHPNLVNVNESVSSQEMMKKKAIQIQQELNIQEPMFRTLLRARYKEFGLSIK